MIVVYGSEDCNYCTKANDLIDDLGLASVYVDVSKDEGAKDMFRERGWRTVPQVFVGDLHIGGYEDLVAYFK